VIAFDLYAATDNEGVTQYRIDPDSIMNVFGGFTTK
jgi:hypothetical protein